MTNSQQQRYIHKRKLGAGAMGEVWLADDTLLNRQVAVKYLAASDEGDHKEYFLSEARSLASLQHPNITLIYDAVLDEVQEKFYLVMEYVKGKSLATVIKESVGPLPLQTTLNVAIDILEALTYAHQRDIVHRDIKPENVLFQKKQTKLTDFGLAGLISVLDKDANEAVGTPNYASPEQIQGMAIDGRADLYALGVTLFEMVTGGRLPFEHHTTLLNILSAHVNEIPPPVTKFTSDVPVALEHVIMQLMAKEPTERYPSAEAVLNILKSLQARQNISQVHLNLLDPDTKPLIGRDNELHQTQQIWSRVQESTKPQLGILKGTTGIGKTRLAIEFISHTIIDQGLIAVAGRSDEFDLPYDPFAEILATILNRQLTGSTIPKDQLHHLLTQIPDLARLVQISIPANQQQTHHANQVQWQFFNAVLTLLTQLGPAVIFIEDATTLDEASLDLLRFLIHREQLPIMFLATCRDTDQDSAWFDTFTANEKSVINVPSLSPPQVKAYLTQWLDSPAPQQAVSLIQQKCHGNPLQIEELTQQLIDTNALQQNRSGQWHYIPPQTQKSLSNISLSPSVNNLLAKRLDQLTHHSRRGLVLAALLKDGYEFDFDIWLTLLGGKSQLSLAGQILDEAREKRIIRQINENIYAFKPIEMGQALILGLPDEERRNLHFEIADILEESESSPILVSYHYEQAGLIVEAARLLEVAGDKAAAGYALNVAIEYYNRSLGLVESGSVYKTLGKLYRQTGKFKASVNSYQHALALAKEANDSANQASILNHLSFTLWWHDQYREAYQQAAAALKLPGSPITEQAIAQSYMGIVSLLVGRLQEAEEWCLKSVEALKQADDKASLAAAYNRLGMVYFSLGKLSRAESVTQTSLELRQKLDDVWGQAYCLNNLGKVAIDRGEFDQALSLFKSAQKLFQMIDSQDGLMVIYTNRGRAILYQGDPETALPWLTKALHLARQMGKQASYGLSDIYLLVALASLQLGEVKRAWAAANDALKIVKSAGNQEYIAIAHATLAQIHAGQNNPSDAEIAYQEAIRLFKQVGNISGLLRTQLNYAQFLQQKGETTVATTMEKEARTEAKKIGMYLPST